MAHGEGEAGGLGAAAWAVSTVGVWWRQKARRCMSSPDEASTGPWTRRKAPVLLAAWGGFCCPRHLTETITEIMEHRRIPKGVPGNQSLLKAGSHSFPRAAGTVRRWRQQAPPQEQGTRKLPGGSWHRGGEAATGHFRCH